MLYMPISMHPFGIQEAIDISISNVFSCIIKGQSCNGYNLIIYDLNNNQIYTTGNVFLGTPIYGDQTLYINIPSTGNGMTNGNSYKWVINLTPDNFTTMITSYYIQFYTNTQSTISINSFPNPISAASYTFTGNYIQLQNIGLQWYEWILSDNLGNVVDDTGKVYNSILLQYTFNGFVKGSNYTLTLSGQSQNGMMCNSGSIFISISYSQSSTIIIPSATVDNNKDAVDIKWKNAVQILGTGSGSVSYTTFNDGKNAVSIGSSSNITWSSNITIPQQFTKWKIVSFPVIPNGIVEQLNNQLNNVPYTVSYNSSTNIFTYIINGYTFTKSFVLQINIPYLIALLPTDLYIRQVS